MSDSFQFLNCDDAKSLITQDDVIVVDIRDSNSFQHGHIPNAVRIDNNNVEDFIAKTAKSNQIVVCCYHGNSSQGAAALLKEEGFAETYSLNGGFEQWRLMYPDKIEQG